MRSIQTRVSSCTQPGALRSGCRACCQNTARERVQQPLHLRFHLRFTGASFGLKPGQGREASSGTGSVGSARTCIFSAEGIRCQSVNFASTQCFQNDRDSGLKTPRLSRGEIQDEKYLFSISKTALKYPAENAAFTGRLSGIIESAEHGDVLRYATQIRNARYASKRSIIVPFLLFFTVNVCAPFPVSGVCV